MSPAPAPRYAEDWHGHYWRVEYVRGGHRQTVYSRMCNDSMCLWGVEIVADVLGQWYARHDPDYGANSWLRTTSSTTSPRFEHWQEAAHWAFEHGLVKAIYGLD